MAAAGLILAAAAPMARAQRADSAVWVARAHSAQRGYEQVRRAHMPWATGGGGGGGGGRCDAHIGRFCYWHGDTYEAPPLESEFVQRARNGLLALLDSAAEAVPGDDWLAGQRVRYWLEAGAPDSALAALTPCAATGWWCDALRGLAKHEAGRDPAALQAYQAALAEMPRDMRCHWLDLSMLLDGDLAHTYGASDCDERAALDARIWWLADPFYSRAGNDAEVEHYARLTIVRLASHSVWPEAQFWDDDLAELITRYGWARWFERERPSPISDPSYSVVGHDPQPGFAFLPSASAVRHPERSTAADWDLQADAATSRYAPPYLRVLEPVRAQFSRFARGDSEIVVAAWDARGDSLIGRRPTAAAVVASASARQIWSSITRNVGQVGSGQVSAPRQNLIVGVEIRADSAYAAARVRQGLAPLATADGRTLSDILLFRPNRALPGNLSEAVPLAEPDVARGDTAAVGLYWELYTPHAGVGDVSVSLTITRSDQSWWTRTRRALHVGGHSTPVALQWRDVARPVNGVVARALVVDLARLQPGTYRIRLRLQPAGSAPLEAERQLTIGIAAR